MPLGFTSGFEGISMICAAALSFGSRRLVPHMRQDLLSTGFMAPRTGHPCNSVVGLAPHLEQNFLSGGLSAPQFGH